MNIVMFCRQNHIFTESLLLQAVLYLTVAQRVGRMLVVACVVEGSGAAVNTPNTQSPSRYCTALQSLSEQTRRQIFPLIPTIP